MLQTLLLSTAGLERVSDWAESNNSHMRIVHVIYELAWDSYAVIIDCSERDATYLSLLEH